MILRRVSLFELSAGAIALVLVAACLAVAGRQWFVADDFAYIAQARGGFPHLPWTLRDVFLPAHPGFNWAYRPVSLETFFLVGNAAFGLHAFGFLATSLAFHFGSGLLVYLLARRLAFHRNAALFAALLAVARFPTLSEVFWICVFSYVLSKFWMLTAVLLALASLRRKQVAAWLGLLLGSTAATALALLSQELAIVTPAIVAAALLIDGRGGDKKTPWSRLSIAAAMQIAVTAVWLFVRFRVIVVAHPPPVYGPFLGWNLVWNPLHQIALVFGSWPFLAAVLAFWLGSSAALAARSPAPVTSMSWLLRVCGLFLIWLAAVLAPFAVVGGPQPRFSIAAEVPLSLLVAAAASVVWTAPGGRLRTMAPVAALVSVLATVPYGVLWERATRPRGAQPRALVEFVERLPHLADDATVVVLYGGEYLAPADAASAFEADAWHSTALLAARPRKRLRLVMRDISKQAAIQPCRACVHVELKPDLTLQPVSPP